MPVTLSSLSAQSPKASNIDSFTIDESSTRAKTGFLTLSISKVERNNNGSSAAQYHASDVALGKHLQEVLPFIHKKKKKQDRLTTKSLILAQDER